VGVGGVKPKNTIVSNVFTSNKESAMEQKIPNQRLKRERELRGWSRAEVARKIGTDERSIRRWENGDVVPLPYYREKLCKLFEKNAEELGFVKEEPPLPPLPVPPGNPEIPKPEIAEIYDLTIPPFPNESRELIGRQMLLGTLAQLLCKYKCVALNGLPGVGKTAIAVALIKHPLVHDTFPDGVLWAGLGPHPNVSEQLSRWERLLEIPVATAAENSLNARVRALRDGIGMRRILLVVDDAWETGAALAFKVCGPNCAFLATTRLRDVSIGIKGKNWNIPELDDDDGLALLAQLAPEAVAQDEDAAQTLAQEVGGLPLALMLMGNYLRINSSSPRRLRDAFGRLHDATHRLHISEPQSPLEYAPSLTADTQISLHAIINVSDMQLDQRTQSVFYALSVFPAKPNSFSEEAALMVAQTEPEILDALHDVGLLENSGGGRYTLHQTIADYAESHLTESLPGKRFVAYCISFLENSISNPDVLERESSNILASMRRAIENHMDTLLVQGIKLFTPFLLERGLHDLARLRLQQAYQVVIWSRNSSQTQDLAQMQLHLGQISYEKEEYKKAEEELLQGLTLTYKYEYYELSCRLLTLLSRVAVQQNNFSEAEAYAQECLELAYKLGEEQCICDALLNFAYIAKACGNRAQVEDTLQKARLLTQQGDFLMDQRLVQEIEQWLAQFPDSHE
jgi:transcriptional regulator with XRE-family HTH domain/tetratricopeptide (TPR) repeat protein